MAYISQEEKKQIAPKVKEICKKYGVKASLSVRHYSTLVCTIKSGKLNPAQNWAETTGKELNGRDLKHWDVNTSWIGDSYSGVVKDFLTELLAALKGADWFDKSDIMTDYFHVAYYIDIQFGKWDKPYILEEA